MHLLFINPVGAIGGAERVLLAAADAVRTLRPAARVSAVLLGPGPLAGELAARGVGVTVLPLPPALAGLGDTQLRAGGRLSRLVRQAATAAPAGLRFLRHFRRTVSRLRPTLIHSNGLKGHLLLAAARPAVPVVWHVHDFYSERPLVAKALRRLRRSAAHAIAISDAVRRDAERVLPGVPVTTVRNAVDLRQFAPGPGDPAALDRLAGLPPADAVRVGLVATYANWKGHGIFLEAIARVPAVRGYVVGGPIYATAGSQVTLEDLKAHAARLGIAERVGFVPFRPDPADVYRALEVVVHASTRPEPFGLTIAEAMACGRTVVLAAAGGAAEFATDGHDALTHAPGNAAGLAAAIARLAGDAELRAGLGAAARATAERRFAAERFAAELVAVYETIPARRASEGC
jgi:glycosyltransferase involved in cell wall biosynthesis